MKKTTFFLILAIAAISETKAQDRHFAWTYETNTLAKGAIDIEPWITFSTGRENFYNRYANRIEFEFGLTDRLQTAFYLNSKNSAEAATDSTGNITGIIKKSGFSFSNEWKWNLMNSSVKPVGVALYGEYTLQPHEVELEYKVLIDKKTEKNIFSFNHVGEFEYEYEFAKGSDGKGEIELEEVMFIENDLAYMRLFKPNFGIGAELRNHNKIADGKWESSPLFLGPTLFYSHMNEGGNGWFMIFNALPQITNAGGDAPTGKPDLKGHEKLESRVILGFSF